MLSKRDLMKSAGLAALAAPFGLRARAEDAKPQESKPQEAKPGFFAAKDAAEAGMLFGLPIVMFYAGLYDLAIDRASGQFRAPFNEIASDHRLFTYKDTAIVTPNSDTPYSMIAMDLRAEPLVLSVPAVDPQRYYSVQLADASTYNFGYIGSRATGNGAGDYLVVGPDWKGETPAGIKRVFRSGAQLGLAIYRTQLFDPTDMDNVVKIQDGYKVQPLSSFLKQPAAAAAPAVDFPKIDKDLAKSNFFEFLDFMLQFIPPAANEAEIRAQLASIGVGQGKNFKFDDLALEQKLEFALGMKQADRRISEAVSSAGANVNNWRVSSAGGDSAHFAGDWLWRAAVARAGIFANDVEEATYPMTREDGEGDRLDGSLHNYEITFPADSLPPVHAFWSVTIYDGKTQLLIQNPIDRYLINSPMLPNLKRNADGSLTIYIQRDSPGAGKESNWLPAPDGPIYLVMRLYWPKTEQPSILPPGKGEWKPPAIRKAV
jgi:hypothetical protein